MNRLLGFSLIAICFAIFGTFMTNAYPQNYENLFNGEDGQFITGNIKVYVEATGEGTFYELESDAYKYLRIIKEDFFYNESNINTYLTTEELKEQGGVCRHYAKWYIQMAQEDGYLAKPVRVNIGNILHEYAQMSNRAGYCILDQTQVIGCWEAKQDE